MLIHFIKKSVKTWKSQEKLLKKHKVREMSKNHFWSVSHSPSGAQYTLFFFYKQSIFNPRPKNCLNFSKKLPQKLFSNYLVDGRLTSFV